MNERKNYLQKKANEVEKSNNQPVTFWFRAVDFSSYPASFSSYFIFLVLRLVRSLLDTL